MCNVVKAAAAAGMYVGAPHAACSLRRARIRVGDLVHGDGDGRMMVKFYLFVLFLHHLPADRSVLVISSSSGKATQVFICARLLGCHAAAYQHGNVQKEYFSGVRR